MTLSALVLAAGTSRRMGTRNKLLVDLNGKPLVRHVCEAVLAATVDSVTVVTGHDADQVRDAVAGLAVTLVHNPHYTSGLSTSVRTGVGSVRDDVDGVLILLGDMPNVDTATIDQLIAAFRDSDGNAIIVPVHQGRRGNPVLFPRAFFAQILSLTGDAGARHILETNKDKVQVLAVDQPGVLFDVDTPDDLSELTEDNKAVPSSPLLKTH